MNLNTNDKTIRFKINKKEIVSFIENIALKIEEHCMVIAVDPRDREHCLQLVDFCIKQNN